MGSKVSVHLAKTILMIPKGQPESKNQRRIDKTMAKRKRTNNIYKTIHRKLKIETPLNKS